MPFASKAQRAYLYANHPKIARKFAEHSGKKPLPEVHHSGKGTKARLNTAAEKNFFGSKESK